MMTQRTRARQIRFVAGIVAAIALVLAIIASVVPWSSFLPQLLWGSRDHITADVNNREDVVLYVAGDASAEEARRVVDSVARWDWAKQVGAVHWREMTLHLSKGREGVAGLAGPFASAGEHGMFGVIRSDWRGNHLHAQCARSRPCGQAALEVLERAVENAERATAFTILGNGSPTQIELNDMERTARIVETLAPLREQLADFSAYKESPPDLANYDHGFRETWAPEAHSLTRVNVTGTDMVAARSHVLQELADWDMSGFQMTDDDAGLTIVGDGTDISAAQELAAQHPSIRIISDDAARLIAAPQPLAELQVLVESLPEETNVESIAMLEHGTPDGVQVHATAAQLRGSWALMDAAGPELVSVSTRRDGPLRLHFEVAPTTGCGAELPCDALAAAAATRGKAVEFVVSTEGLSHSRDEVAWSPHEGASFSIMESPAAQDLYEALRRVN